MLNTIAYSIKKSLQLFVFIICILFILTSIAIFLLPHFFNADAFKYHIESILMDELQRIVRINDVSVSFLPGIHIQLSGIHVSDAAGFGLTPQIQGHSSEIYLDIWPLFEKKIVIKRIVFHQFAIKLTQKENGRDNWSDLISTKKMSQKTGNENARPFSLQTHLNITINDSKIDIDDHMRHRHFKISHLDYHSTGYIQNIIHLSFDMSGALVTKNGPCKFETHTELDGRASLMVKQGRYSINDAHLQMNTTALLPNDFFVESHMESTIALSYEHAALELTDMQLYINDVLLQGNIYASDLIDMPAISGQINMHTQNHVQNIPIFSQHIGFNGPLQADILFQTHGNTLESCLKEAEIELILNTGPGNMVLPGQINKDHLLLQHLSKADLHIKLSPLQGLSNKEFQYGFQTKLDGKIVEMGSVLDAIFKTRSQVLFGSDLKNICINNGDFHINAHWKKLTGGPHIIKGKASGNSKTKKAIVKNVSISGPLVNGQFSSEMIIQNDTPTISSQVKIKMNQARNIFQAFSLRIPRFKDVKTFNNLEFDGDIVLTADNMQLTSMTFKMDDVEILGNMTYHYHPSFLHFNITANQFNFDRHWMLSSEAHDSQSDQNDAIIMMGSIQCNDFQISNISVDRMHVNVSSKDNMIRLSPIIGQIYGGKFRGHLTFDLRPNVPKTSLLLHCENVQINPLLNDYNQFDHITGLLNMKASLSWDLNKGDMVLSSINGNAKIELTHGIINGIQLVPSEVQKQILEMHQQQSLNMPKQQYFDSVTGIVRFRNGCIHNSNLIADTKGLRLKGKGTFDIVKKEADYTFYVGTANFPVIPYHVNGPISDLKMNLKKTEFLKIAVSDFFHQAGKLGPETIKDTLELSGKMMALNTETLQATVDKSAETIKKTIHSSSTTIKEIIVIGADILNAGKEALISIGNRLRGLFFSQDYEDEKNP